MTAVGGTHRREPPGQELGHWREADPRSDFWFSGSSAISLASKVNPVWEVESQPRALVAPELSRTLTPGL